MGREQALTNCISFVRHRLGLDPEETYLDPFFVDIRDLRKDFEVSSPENADIVAILGFIGDKKRVVHMAVRAGDRRERRYEHRPGINKKPESVQDEELRPDGEYGHRGIGDDCELLKSLEHKLYFRLKVR